MDATTNQIDKDDELAGDLLVGRKNIRKFLIDLGMPEKVDPSYLKKRRWPIGKSGASLIASKRRLARYVQKLTTPTT